MQTGTPSQRHTDEDAPACPEFESTLLLMDGTLVDLPRATALSHARICEICGPLVTDWPAVTEQLQAHFEDAAELAKPGLAEMPSRVLAAAEKQEKRQLPAWLRAPALRYPVYASLGAAAAFMLLVLPVQPTPHPAVVPVPVAVPVAAPQVAMVKPVVALPAPPAAPVEAVPAAPAEVDPANDCHMHQLAFDGADGMVYRTPTDGMTVIWVTEHDGA